MRILCGGGKVSWIDSHRRWNKNGLGENRGDSEMGDPRLRKRRASIFRLCEFLSTIYIEIFAMDEIVNRVNKGRTNND